MAKEYAKAFYRSKAWLQCRAGYINSVNGMCERCLKQGKYKPGKIVHHINYITPKNINDPNITLNWKNLELVCHECHEQIHKGSNRSLRDDVMFDNDGNLIKKSD